MTSESADVLSYEVQQEPVSKYIFTRYLVSITYGLLIIVKVLFCDQLPERIDCEYDDVDFHRAIRL